MQCASPEAPTTNVVRYTRAICPIMKRVAVTSHAINAMIHPPATPAQKIEPKLPCTTCVPRSTRLDLIPGANASVWVINVAKSNAPATLAVNTTPHSRRVLKTCRFWSSTSMTGKRVFSVNSYERPSTTTMNPRGYRSEEHTSELQSRFDLVCRLLLEKKKH